MALVVGSVAGDKFGGVFLTTYDPCAGTAGTPITITTSCTTSCGAWAASRTPPIQSCILVSGGCTGDKAGTPVIKWYKGSTGCSGGIEVSSTTLPASAPTAPCMTDLYAARGRRDHQLCRPYLGDPDCTRCVQLSSCNCGVFDVHIYLQLNIDHELRLVLVRCFVARVR